MPGVVRDKVLTTVLPEWLIQFVASHSGKLDNPSDLEAAMQLANQLALLHIEAKAGGPFGAIVYNNETGEIIGWGVNLVEKNDDPTLHGEMTAIRIATAHIGKFTVGDAGDFTLVTSAAPCGMCETAAVWAGVKRIVCGATSADVESIIGFDEGLVHPQQCAEYDRRGITLVSEVLREQCCATLRRYVELGGTVYNGQADE